MTKIELIAKIAETQYITKKEAGEMVESVVGAMQNGIIEDGELAIFGFGKFVVKQRAERVGRNPKTGEEIVIPTSKSVTFKPAKALRDEVNK